HQRTKNWTICDAGWMAMSADRSTASQSMDQYLGVVCDVHGRPFDDLLVVHASQEHGVIAARPGSGSEIPDLPVGTRLRILPNHACATAAQHERYRVVDHDLQIHHTWARFGGW
ncbi:MAG: DSD1 family PLP-dependent enzyme, partial [Rhodospirillaceae bacterium]|nr:DSD1 family PLP-dependent enzyme [Rhodospirillaceae bacterium]